MDNKQRQYLQTKLLRKRVLLAQHERAVIKYRENDREVIADIVARHIEEMKQDIRDLNDQLEQQETPPVGGVLDHTPETE